MKMIVEEKRYEVSDVFRMIGDENLNRKDSNGKSNSDIEVDGFLVHPISLRYMTFYQRGTACVCCGKQGTHFRLCGDPTTNRRHFNLYAEDGMLMTRDHIIPKSRGGKDEVDNMQPMCVRCNAKKGNKSDIKTTYVVAACRQSGQEMTFQDIKKAAKHIVLSYMKPQANDQKATVCAAISAVLNIQTAIANHSEYAGFEWSLAER